MAFDRQLLGEPGLALSDEEYVQTIAGLGSGKIFILAPLNQTRHCLDWSALDFLSNLNEDTPSAASETYRDIWIAKLRDVPDRRILVNADSFLSSDAPELTDIVRILSHRAAGLDSVVVHISSIDADIKWQWPLRVTAPAEEFEILELGVLRDRWPSRSMARPQKLSRENARAEVLVLQSDVRDALRRILELPYRVRAGYILLVAPVDFNWNEYRNHIQAIISETQAGGISLISLPPDESLVERLNGWIGQLSHNLLFDEALSRAFPRDTSLHFLDVGFIERTALPFAASQLGHRITSLSPNASFELPPDSGDRINLYWTSAEPLSSLGNELQARATDLPFDHESDGGTAISEISDAEREARRELAQRESPRYLKGDLRRIAEGEMIAEERGLIVGERYVLDVFIDETDQTALIADVPFPDEGLDWGERDSHTLQVLFAEPRQWSEPLRGTLELPRVGPSGKCRFTFTPGVEGPFAGRVTLYYRGRILQTALLEAEIVPTLNDLNGRDELQPIRLRIEAAIRRSLTMLEDRRRFDACMVFNHSANHVGTMTGAGKDGAYIATLDGIAPQLANINALLNQVALDVMPYSKGLRSKANASLLVNLATEGCFLYRSLVQDYIQHSSAAKSIMDGEFLQIVTTQPDAIVPLEFVYEYRPPKQDAPVCKNAKRALETGRCPAECIPTETPAPHVCPLGFWGLSKVIERHLHDPALGPAAQVLSEPEIGRDVLTLKGAVLLAASEQVPKGDRTRLNKTVRSEWGAAEMVNDWEEWKATVKKTKPVVLLALPHASGTGAQISLEISGDVLQSLFINSDYVRASLDQPPPIALLLGCDTMNVAYKDAYAKHVAVFRQADAALVLGTVATVFGPDAAKMASRLVVHLANAANANSERFGEVLRQAKRAAVADSLMIALCLVAFGDADWRLD